MIRVRCVGDLLCGYVGSDGRSVAGRFAGRDKKRAALPDGELVADLPYYARAIARGDLELVADSPAKAAKPTAIPPAPVAKEPQS